MRRALGVEHAATRAADQVLRLDLLGRTGRRIAGPALAHQTAPALAVGAHHGGEVGGAAAGDGVGAEPGAVCEGVVAEQSFGERIEFGKVDPDGQRIYGRRLGRSPFEWRSYDRKEVGVLFGRHETGEAQTRWSFAAPEFNEEMRRQRAAAFAGS